MMKNKIVLGLALSLVMLSSANSTFANEEASANKEPMKTEAESSDPKEKKATPKMDFSGVNSLRGKNALTSIAETTDNKHLPADGLPIARNYFQQPPLIPHRIREYKISINNNKCLSCHSWKNYKKARATKISQTHFLDRDGNAQSTVAARRYFCTQCHVPQVDAKPLVENIFKPVSQLK